MTSSESKVDEVDLRALSAKEARLLFRSGKLSSPTSGVCDGYLQANMVILPEQHAKDYQKYCELNSRPCPVLEILTPGDPVIRKTSRDADIRTDIPKYNIYTFGNNSIQRKEVTDCTPYFSHDSVGFLLGCSFTFEAALAAAGVYKVPEGSNVPMFKTSIKTKECGIFGGPLVVTMRPIKKSKIKDAYEITEPFKKAHGAPIHHGDPAKLGIQDISNPDFGTRASVRDDEVPVFWACGVTSQMAVMDALEKGHLETVITHTPGHMFITDRKSLDIFDDEVGDLENYERINALLARL